MKKAAVFFVIVILSVLCNVQVFAAEHSMPREQDIDVFAKAVYTLPDGCYDAEEIVELPDGTEIKITPKTPVTSLRLVVDPITREDVQAYQWLSECAVKLGTDLLFYDIYFIDEYGNRVNMDLASDVSITLPKNYGTPKTAAVSADGTVSLMSSDFSDNKVSFTIERGGYYAVASVRDGASGSANSSQTGDNSHLGLWLILLAVSGISFVGSSVWGNAKKSDK